MFRSVENDSKLNLTGVNGQNICLTCENLESCTVNETFVSNHEDDDNKIVLREPQDESDPKIDNCMIPNYTIKGNVPSISQLV